MKKSFNDIKVGDVVVLTSCNRNHTPNEYTVVKKGHKYIHIQIYGRSLTSFDALNGHGEYGYDLFPGTLSEYNEYVSNKEMTFDLVEKIKKIKVLTRSQIERINNILSE